MFLVFGLGWVALWVKQSKCVCECLCVRISICVYVTKISVSVTAALCNLSIGTDDLNSDGVSGRLSMGFVNHKILQRSDRVSTLLALHYNPHITTSNKHARIAHNRLKNQYLRNDLWCLSRVCVLLRQTVFCQCISTSCCCSRWFCAVVVGSTLVVVVENSSYRDASAAHMSATKPHLSSGIWNGYFCLLNVLRVGYVGIKDRRVCECVSCLWPFGCL